MTDPYAPDYNPKNSNLCCTHYKDRQNFNQLIDNLELAPIDKQHVRLRYLSILETFQRRTRNHSIIFFVGHFIVMVGSLLVPALLSISNTDKSILANNGMFNVYVYWATFVISLMVTMSNGILTLFRIDKKYYFLNTALERLRSEGWQYIALTGRYSGHLIENTIPTHKNQFVFFIHNIEKMKLKQVEEEYHKMEEKTQELSNQKNTNSISAELYSPSPDQSIIHMKKDVPNIVKNVVNSIIKSNKILEPINTLVEPLNTLVEPINTLVEPINTLVEPINTLVEPINKIVEQVNIDINTNISDLTDSDT